MSKFIFITWEKHQRTRSLCNKLDIPLFELISLEKGVRRYIELTLRTTRTIREEKPSTLFIQNPSIILAVLATCLKYIFKYKLIVDAHNEAIEPFIHNNFFMRYISKLIISLADRTIVTNDVLAKKVEFIGGKSIVLPDFLPNIMPRNYLPFVENTQWQITLICTYACDEPYEEVFKAIDKLGSISILNVTGKIPAKLNTLTIPSNVKLLGFLSEHDYWETLFNSHIIIDLTTMRDCLVCGAYEALAIEKPTLLSANKASILLFGAFAYHVQNTADNIKNGLEYIIDNYDNLRESIYQAKIDFLQQENLRIKELVTIIE